jgi:uncharacterized membrane protein
LWQWQATQGHARGPKTQESQTEMREHSSKKRVDLTAVQSKDKRDVCMLNNIYDMPQEENLCNEQGNVIMLEIVKDYNHLMGYVEKDDRITNTYSISHRPWKWTKSCSI